MEYDEWVRIMEFQGIVPPPPLEFKVDSWVLDLKGELLEKERRIMDLTLENTTLRKRVAERDASIHNAIRRGK
jgi:hypothetical protein